nr:MAG TPA: hypothetical protein [Caudoviricetes sp.]
MWICIYTPLPGLFLATLTGRTLCPMGSLSRHKRCLSDAFGSGQGNVKAFNTPSIRQTLVY